MELATGWCIGDPKVDLRGLQVGDLRELRNGQNWPVVLPGQYTPQCRPSGTYMPIGIDRTRPGIGSAAIAKFQHETRLRLLLHAQPDVSVFEPMRRVRAYFGSLPARILRNMLITVPTEITQTHINQQSEHVHL